MNKFLLAISMLAASLTANAQSNVTIYGVADATVEAVSAKGAANGVERGTFSRVNSTASYIGFKGSEDLGNGLKALFQIETDVATDNNTGFTGGRDTFVGLSSANAGTVLFGTLTGPTRTAGQLADSRFNVSGVAAGTAVFGKPTGGSGSGTFDTRFSNAIAYISPTFNGLTATAAYSAGENKSVSGAAAADVKNTSGYDLGLTYKTGPLTTALTHAELRNRLDNSAAGTNLDNSKLTRLVSVYSFNGGHKVSAMIERSKNEYTGLAGASLARNAWGLGGKYQLTSSDAIVAQYFQANNPSGSFYADNSNRKASIYEIGYEHYLSKRTALKTAYTALNNQSSADYDFSANAIGGGNGSGVDYKVLSAGIRHAF